MAGFVVGVETCCVCGSPLPEDEKVAVERPIPDSATFMGCILTAEVHAACGDRFEAGARLDYGKGLPPSSSSSRSSNWRRAFWLALAGRAGERS